jgi:S1-C subfamily serine protease
VELPHTRYVSEVQTARGAEVTGVSPPTGPAARAGLAKRDVIIEFNGVPVNSSDHLVRLVQYTPVGTETEITYLRRGVKHKTSVRLGDRDELLSVATADH